MLLHARERPLRGQRGFTLIELLVVVGILGALAGILFPVYARARDAGRKVTCQSNLRQIGVAFSLYLRDHDDGFPNNGDPYLWMGRRWRWPMRPYLLLAIGRDPSDPDNPNKSVGGGPSILYCPSDPTAPSLWDSTSYGYSAAFYHTPEQINQMTTADLWQLNRFPTVTQRLGAVRWPSQKALAAEWQTNHEGIKVGWWDWRGGRNYLFVDGHVRYLPAERIAPAANGFPDINLTVDGICGRDLREE